jgi:CHASE3 domain sensor protein
MGIRTKILMGFLILVLMLFISGALSVFELTKLGNAIKGLITDNYRSIEYSKALLEELEMQEKSALAFVSSGKTDHTIHFEMAHSSVIAKLDSARMHLTNNSEKLYVDSIAESYNQFYTLALSFFDSKTITLDSYLRELHPKYLETASHIKQLMTLNQSALYQTAAYLEGSAQRVVMPGLIVILTSIIFTLVFVYLVNHYFVSPIIKLTKGINDYVKYQRPFDVPLETKDELSSLKDSIVNLISFCRLEVKKKAEN